MKKPKIVVVGVPNDCLSDPDSFVTRIKNKMETINNPEINFVKKYIPAGKKLNNVLLEASQDSFSHLMHVKRVFFGWESFPVYEFVSVLRCFHCWKYGHMSGNCTQESPTCPKCGTEHELKDCNTQIKACVNCKYAKNVLKVSEINYDHTVFVSLTAVTREE